MTRTTDGVRTTRKGAIRYDTYPSHRGGHGLQIRAIHYERYPRHRGFFSYHAKGFARQRGV